MAFLFGAKGNNPDKLLDKFNKSNKPAVRHELIDEMIQLKAWNQLEQLMETEFRGRIVEEMVEAYKSDAEKLFSLYNKANIAKLKDKIVEYILDTGDEAMIWALGKTDHKFKIIGFIMTEYKDDAEVLRAVFEQDIPELREAVVKRLIELKAEKELLTIKDPQFQGLILDNLIVLNRENSSKLAELLQLTNNKAQINTIVKFFVENGADEELWKLVDTEFNEQIIRFFFTKSRDDAAALVELFNNHKFKNKKAIVERLFELNANEQLFNLAGDEFFEEINEFLIQLNLNNPEKLLAIFNRTAQADLKNTIVHMLIELSAEKQLWSLCDSEYSHVIMHCLINLNQDNPEKMLILYPQTQLNEHKEQIVKQLIQAKAEEQLWQLMNSEFKDIIIPELVSMNSDNSKKLYSLFYKAQTYDLKFTIVNHLMDLDAEQMLWLLMSTEFSETICEYLYSVYINDSEKLFSIYDKTTGNLKRQILDRLIALKAEAILWKLLETSAKEKVYPSLIDICYQDAAKLWQLYEKTEDSDLRKSIVVYLMELKAKDQLLKLSDSEFKDMILPVLLKILPQKDVFAQYNPLEIALGVMHNKNYNCTEFLAEYADLLQLAFSNKLLAIYYFRRLKDREQTFLMLTHYGLGKYVDLPDTGISLESISDFFPKVSDCFELGLKEYSDLFKKVFSLAFKNRDRDLLILSYLLDRNKFRLNVKLVKDNYNIIDDLNELKSYRNQIKIKYAELLKQAVSKEDVELLVKKRDKELEKFVGRELFNMLNEIDNAKVTIPQISLPKFSKNDQNNDAKGELIDLLALPADVAIISNFNEAKQAIEKELESILLSVEETDDILKAKGEADEKIKKITDLNNFCFSLDSTGEKLVDNKQFKQMMIQIFQQNTLFECRRAILDFLHKADRPLWFKALLIIAKTKDIHCLAYCFMKYHLVYSAKSLQVLFRYFSTKFSVDIKFIKKISGLLEKDINDHKIDKVQNEMVIWDVIFIYLVILLENVHFLYFNATKEDLQVLNLSIKYINNLPSNIQPLIVSILNDIIKIAEGQKLN